MTMFYLIRHGHTDLIGKVLCGRMSGVHLNVEGRAQARRLAERFRGVPIVSVYSSPLERAVETAEPLAESLGLPLRIAADISEVDYGDWTGRAFETISDDQRWKQRHSWRSGLHIPGAETPIQVQNRVVGWIAGIHRESADGHFAVVSHGDPIKSAVAFYAGLHIDQFSRIDISPASVTALRIDDHGPCVLTLNNLESLQR